MTQKKIHANKPRCWHCMGVFAMIGGVYLKYTVQLHDGKLVDVHQCCMEACLAAEKRVTVGMPDSSRKPAHE